MYFCLFWGFAYPERVDFYLNWGKAGFWISRNMVFCCFWSYAIWESRTAGWVDGMVGSGGGDWEVFQWVGLPGTGDWGGEGQLVDPARDEMDRCL